MRNLLYQGKSRKWFRRRNKSILGIWECAECGEVLSQNTPQDVQPGYCPNCRYPYAVFHLNKEGW